MASQVADLPTQFAMVQKAASKLRVTDEVPSQQQNIMTAAAQYLETKQKNRMARLLQWWKESWV